MIAIRLIFLIVLFAPKHCGAWLHSCTVNGKCIQRLRVATKLYAGKPSTFIPLLHFNSTVHNDGRRSPVFDSFPGADTISVQRLDSGKKLFAASSILDSSEQDVWKYHLNRKKAEAQLNNAVVTGEENIEEYFKEYNKFTEIDKAELLQTNDNFFHALDMNDMLTMRSLWLDSEECLCRLGYPKDVISGYENIMAYFEAMTPAMTTTELVHVNLHYMGDVAIVSSEIRYKISANKLRKQGLKNKIIEGYVTNVFVKSHLSGRYHLLTHLASMKKYTHPHKSVFRDPTIAPPVARPQQSGTSLGSILGNLNLGVGDGDEEEFGMDEEEDFEDGEDDSDDDEDYMDESNSNNYNPSLSANGFGTSSNYQQNRKARIKKEEDDSDDDLEDDNDASFDDENLPDQDSRLSRHRKSDNRKRYLPGKFGKPTIIPRKNGFVVVTPMKNDGSSNNNNNMNQRSPNSENYSTDRLQSLLADAIRERLSNMHNNRNGNNNINSKIPIVVVRTNGDTNSGEDSMNNILNSVRKSVLDAMNKNNNNNEDDSSSMRNRLNSSRNNQNRSNRNRVKSSRKNNSSTRIRSRNEVDDDDDSEDGDDYASDEESDNSDDEDYDSEEDDEEDEGLEDNEEEALEREKRLINAATESLITWFEQNNHVASTTTKKKSPLSAPLALTAAEASELRTDLIIAATQGVPSKVETAFAMLICQRKPRYLGGEVLLTMENVPRTSGQFAMLAQQHKVDMQDLLSLWKRHVRDLVSSESKEIAEDDEQQNEDRALRKMKSSLASLKKGKSLMSRFGGRKEEEDSDDEDDAEYESDEDYNNDDDEYDNDLAEGVLEAGADFFADLLKAQGLSPEEEGIILEKGNAETAKPPMNSDEATSVIHTNGNSNKKKKTVATITSTKDNKTQSKTSARNPSPKHSQKGMPSSRPSTVSQKLQQKKQQLKEQETQPAASDTAVPAVKVKVPRGAKKVDKPIAPVSDTVVLTAIDSEEKDSKKKQPTADDKKRKRGKESEIDINDSSSPPEKKQRKKRQGKSDDNTSPTM